MIVLPFNSKPRQLVAGLSALCLAAVLAFAGPAGAAVGDPAGNNGTIKIDGVALDDAPNNEPHPGCSFEVDFYGFDAGADHNATVTFAVHNPTRGDDILKVDNEVVFIGGDANDGGGSEAGLDASQGYNLYPALSAGGYEPGRMGYHIKLTVHADGSHGADTKHKVFWVTDCVPSAVPPVVPPVDADVTPPPAGTTDVPLSNPIPSVTSTGNDVLVLGETLTRPDVTAAPGELPRTGSAVAPSLVLGAILLMLGALSRRLGKVRKVIRT